MAMPIILFVQRDRYAPSRKYSPNLEISTVWPSLPSTSARSRNPCGRSCRWAAPGREVLHGDFHEHDRFLAHDLLFLEEARLGAVEDVLGRVGQRAEAAALDEHRLFIEQFVRADDLAVGREHGRVGKPLLDQLERHEPVVDVMEIRPGELDDVHLDALDRQAVEQRADELFRVLVQVERAVDEVDADDAQRLLLLDVFLIQHADVDDDLVRLGARVRLVADAQPAVALGGVVVALGGDGVGEGEEARAPARLSASRSMSSLYSYSSIW